MQSWDLRGGPSGACSQPALPAASAPARSQTGRATFRSLRFRLLLDGRGILRISGRGSSRPSVNAPRGGELTASWASPSEAARCGGPETFVSKEPRNQPPSVPSESPPERSASPGGQTVCPSSFAYGRTESSPLGQRGGCPAEGCAVGAGGRGRCRHPWEETPTHVTGLSSQVVSDLSG